MDAFAPNAMTAEEVAALLAGGPFASASALVIAAGNPLRAVFATPAMLAMFAAPNLGALDSVIFGADSPGARRFRQLAQSMTVGAPARLEQLRFFRAGNPLPLGLICARMAAPGGGEFLVAGSPARSSEAASPLVLAPAFGPAAAGEGAAAPFALPLDGPVRFLWSLDAEDRFGPTDFALSARLGPNAPRPGETSKDLLARLRLDGANALAQAIASRRTFSALRFEWPEASGARARVVLISGAAAFDRERNFSGFRGFGVFTGEDAPFAAPLFEGPIETHADIEEPAPVETAATFEPLQAETPVRSGRDGGAEIVVLRPGAAIAHGGPNVVPIRPNALTGLPPQPGDDERREETESVELTLEERDAFREIARALGVRPREQSGEDRQETPHAPFASEDLAGESALSPQPDRALEAPAAADRNASALIDLLPIGALVTRDGEAIYANRTLLDLVGFASLEELRAAGGVEHIFAGRDPAAAPAPEGGIAMAAADRQSLKVDVQARAIAWDGAPATLISVRRSREAEHEAQVQAIERDAAANSTRARDLETALGAAADGFIRLDALGRILAMNQRAEALFGYEEKLAVGESFLILLSPTVQGEAAAGLDRVARAPTGARERQALEVVARDREGRTFPVRLALGAFADPAKREFFAVFLDLSREKAAQLEWQATSAAAAKASALKTEFLARVSHEIRTPLHAILGFAEVMMEERFGPIGNERYRDYVKDIHASGQHVMSLANDLLDLSKIEAGKMELEFAPIDINRIIRECVALMQPQAARERVIVRLSLFDSLPNVMADERSLRQIMLNLMSNAVKFNEPGGQVIVSTAVDEAGQALIRVRDTGVGMNESELDVALEPFRRVGGARRDDGTGLGLPLTKALVEANRADFSIKSRKEHGTLVEVAFPTVRAAQ